jgi:hypothetical protein
MSKPKIDLTDPAISGVIRSYMDQAKQATTFAAAKDNAVRPVYALNEHTRVVEHVGSCVLFKVRDSFFGLSASHVFDSVGKYQLLFGHDNRLHSFAGDRFSSAKGRSGSHQDDPIDSSVFHFTPDIASELASSFLSLEDLDFGIADRKPELYVAAGYRVSQSRSNSRGHSTRLDRYPSVELDDKHYEHWKLSRDMHLLLSFEDQVLVNGHWQQSPSIRGLSGGAIFRIPGLLALASAPQSEIGKIKLAAILIEHRTGQRDRILGAAVGTRLGIYFQLIHHYLPEIQFDKIVAAEFARQNT